MNKIPPDVDRPAIIWDCNHDGKDSYDYLYKYVFLTIGYALGILISEFI